MISEVINFLPIRNNDRALPKTLKSTVVCEGKIYILARQKNSTLQYYFENLGEFFTKNARFINSIDELGVNEDISNVTLIIIRDVSLAQIKKISNLNRNIRSIIWFIDDDIPAIGEDFTIPKSYQKRLSKWYKYSYPLLSNLCDEIWVSTPHLAEKYNLSPDCILEPIQLEKHSKPVRCFYHGSGSHTLEWEFLKTFTAKVQRHYGNIHFELIGDHQLNKAFRDIPRVSILHPMSWQNYQAHIASREMDIGLVPLFDSPFNRARSHTKLFDIERQGAIGIYANRFSAAIEIDAYQAGFLADDSLESWLAAFDRALNSDRAAVYENSTRLVADLSERARTQGAGARLRSQEQEEAAEV